MQIGGVDTYVATPDKTKSNGHVLLFFPNAFGLHINDFLTMDAFAACGYLTLGVDYFAGDPIWKHSQSPLNDPTFDFQSWKNKHMEFTDRIAAKWVKDVEAEAGAIAHLSFMNESHVFGIDDSLFMPEQRPRAVEIMTNENKEFIMQISSPMLHMNLQ
ncbi:hypothetical protein AKAW_09456 [Aspergillus luchuensis IFO 4308]|nr:hypothetical protein AKAW_09456 [Aspergillus luchuensis IFO 4308]